MKWAQVSAKSTHNAWGVFNSQKFIVQLVFLLVAFIIVINIISSFGLYSISSLTNSHDEARLSGFGDSYNHKLIQGDKYLYI